MALDERIQYWVEVAEYDLETADAMLRTDRLLYVGFMCHLATEKMLKAHVAKATQQMPPKTHNLPRLADLAGLLAGLSEVQKDFIALLNPLNVESRYPEYIKDLTNRFTREHAEDTLRQTKEFVAWLRNQL